jgi:hypothetical protein
MVAAKRRKATPYDSNSVGVLLNNSGAPPTTTTLVSSANPVALNEVFTYTATVTSQAGGTLTGTVTFKDGGTPVANVTLTNNQAVYSTSYTKKTQLGAHAITAWYWGELNTAEGDGSAPLTEYALTPTSTETQVTTSGSPSQLGQLVTFKAVVTSSYGAPPDGEIVTFDDGKTVLGSAALAGGTAVYTTSTLPVGINAIKAVYAGDAVYRRSIGKLKQVVNKYETTSSVSSSLNPSQSGQAVTFTATVTSAGPTPSGTVKFIDGERTIGSATLSGGVATLTTSKLAVGTHPITAKYLGDADNATSTSPVLDQVVQ